mgnify:CR=1 FL=1
MAWRSRKWAYISAACLIVEAGLANYRIDPSQGSHFFQNVTSLGVGYFTIDDYKDDGIYRKDLLDAMPAVYETEFVRHVRFSRPLKIMMDGMKQEALFCCLKMTDAYFLLLYRGCST